MKPQSNFSGMQLATLFLLRMLIGWHILYEGLAKLLNPQWSSLSFLSQSNGILEGFARWVTSNPGVLNTVDFLNTWGLIAIGLGLMLGLFARTAALFGAALLFVYYLNSPPMVGVEYVLPVDGNYLIVDKTLIESVALCILALFPTSRIIGLDALISRCKYLKNKE
jgi:thiosulfate dehydrogenase (quinone) large subunit